MKKLITTGVCVVFAAACLAFGTACTSYVTIDGVKYAADTPELDLRETVTAQEDYLRYRESLPDCDIRWSIPLSGTLHDSQAVSLKLDSLCGEDIPQFAFFSRLQEVDASACEDYAALAELDEVCPELKVRWKVSLGGRPFERAVRNLTLDTADVTLQELTERLGYLPALESVTFTGKPLSMEEQDVLSSAFPELKFHWDIVLCGDVFPGDAQSISFAGREDLTGKELALICEESRRFPALESIDFTGCSFSNEELGRAAQQLDGVDLIWTLNIYGVDVCSTDTELDFSRKRIWDNGAELEELLYCFPNLEKVIMSECGISNEDMDALNQKYENIRFVWTVHFSAFSMRTDETNFIAARTRNEFPLHSGDLTVLKYCTDLQALDLGHKEIYDLSFLYDLPHLRYLILVETDIQFIEPIGSLKELEYLEMFLTRVEDLTPLTGCTSLIDLNISYVYAKPDNAYKTLMQMPQLKRLWYCNCHMTEEQLADVRAIMPECEMYLDMHGESTGGGWREHERYYEMRDFFGMYYMPGGTNGVDANGHQIVHSG